MAISRYNVMNQVQKLITALDPDIPMILRGTNFPEGANDFLRLDMLAEMPNVGRPKDFSFKLPFELTCYSRHALHRTDQKKYKNSWAFSEPYFEFLNQKRYIIETACIQFKEARRIYLDLSSLGDFAVQINQQSPKLNIECIVIEVDATINQVKE